MASCSCPQFPPHLHSCHVWMLDTSVHACAHTHTHTHIHTHTHTHTYSPTPPAGLHQQEARMARPDPWETRALTTPLALCSPSRAWPSPSTHHCFCWAFCTWPSTTIFQDQLSHLPATQVGRALPVSDPSLVLTDFFLFGPRSYHSFNNGAGSTS